MTDPKDMPERIWAHGYDQVWWECKFDDSTEYIRADLARPPLDAEAVYMKVLAWGHRAPFTSSSAARHDAWERDLRRILAEALGGSDGH